MIYYLADIVDFFYCISVADLRKCIISTILNFISRNKFDWFKVGGFFLYIPADWYHVGIGICRDVGMA